MDQKKPKPVFHLDGRDAVGPEELLEEVRMIRDEVYRATEREVKRGRAPEVNYGDVERKLLMNVYGPTGRKQRPRFDVAVTGACAADLERKALEEARKFFGSKYSLEVVPDYKAHKLMDKTTGEFTDHYEATVGVEGTLITEKKEKKDA
jgi:hypothetical protein